MDRAKGVVRLAEIPSSGQDMISTCEDCLSVVDEVSEAYDETAWQQEEIFEDIVGVSSLAPSRVPSPPPVVEAAETPLLSPAREVIFQKERKLKALKSQPPPTPPPADSLAPVIPPPSAAVSPSTNLLGHIKLAHVLGQGSYGCVYLGVKQNSACLPELVAVKKIILSQVDTSTEEAAHLLWREVEVTKQLKHPNIVKFHGTHKDSTSINIIMDFYPGGTLAQLVEKVGSLTENVARGFTAQILKGVEYLHRKKIIHRDIKGANILLSATGVLKLADFGTCRELTDSHTRLVSLQGTPHWMAPEVIKHTGHSLPADIWSIGCTVIEMLSGRPPFSEYETSYAAMFAVANTEELQLPDVSPPCQEFLRGCLERDEKQRLTAKRLIDLRWIVAPSSSHVNAAEKNGAGSTQVMDHINKMAGTYNKFARDLVRSERINRQSERRVAAPHPGTHQRNGHKKLGYVSRTFDIHSRLRKRGYHTQVTNADGSTPTPSGHRLRSGSSGFLPAHSHPHQRSRPLSLFH